MCAEPLLTGFEKITCLIRVLCYSENPNWWMPVVVDEVITY